MPIRRVPRPRPVVREVVGDAVTPRTRGRALSSLMLCPLVVGALVLGGCGMGTAPSPPSGVDGLVVPTPSPRAADFVDRIDHPWLAVRAGARWRFADATTIAVGEGERHDGIATTALVTTAADGTTSVDLLAQDRSGAVWLLGRRPPGAMTTTWFAEAGLVLPARPRRGDGFVRVPGSASMGPPVVAQVLATGASERTPAGAFDDVVVVGLDVEGTDLTDAYARGIGPIVHRDSALVERTG